MSEFDKTSYLKLSHAYIADAGTADALAMAAVCSSNSRGNGNSRSNSSSNNSSIPCGVCKDCDKAMRRIHPDIITVDRLKDSSGKLRREIIIDQIRSLKADIYIAPNEAARKVYIINDADLMNIYAQNTFLQMLEEPPAHVVFILKVTTSHTLLPTVRSRCIDLSTAAPPANDLPQPRQTRDTDTQNTDDLREAGQLAADFADALCDNLLLVKCMFRLEQLDRAAFDGFISFTRERLSRMLHKDPGNKQVILADALLAKANEMLDLNVSIGHVSGMLCAGLMQDTI